MTILLHSSDQCSRFKEIKIFQQYIIYFFFLPVAVMFLDKICFYPKNGQPYPYLGCFKLSDCIAGIEDLLSTLHHIRNRLNTGDNTSSSAGGHQVTFLKTLFHNPQFQQAVIMHQKMVDITSRSPHPHPVRTDARELFMEVRSASPSKSNEPAMKELIQLLSKPHMKASKDFVFAVITSFSFFFP